MTKNGDKKCQDYNKFRIRYFIYYLTVFKALVYASVSLHRSYPLERTSELSASCSGHSSVFNRSQFLFL